MVLIVTNHRDPSANKVMDWLAHMGTACLRLNSEEMFSPSSEISFRIGPQNTDVDLGPTSTGKELPLSAIWFRRDSEHQLPSSQFSEIQNEPYFHALTKHLREELSTARYGLYSCITPDTRILGNFKRYRVNKLETLLIAGSCGLDIPQSLVSNRKSQLAGFIAAHGTVITKSMSESWGLQKNGEETYVLFTEEIDPDTLDTLPETFHYSLFQEKLSKVFEIRTFYLVGKCYSMAIFSQLDPQSSTDFRKYGLARNVPFKLSPVIEQKITRLMNELQLNTGSIDLVRTPDDRTVFLEVNPIGQYDMTSVPCNYQLDKKIAEYLAAHETK